MAVLNRTPDSFFDGGTLLEDRRALAFAENAIEAGADILDLGGESTRPGARPVSAKEEIRRTLPILRKILKRHRIPISIDTMKSEVAEAALSEGAVMVNDVSGLRHDPSLARVAARHRAGLILVHSRGSPQTMRRLTRYRNLIGEVGSELEQAMDRALDAGAARQKLILDPGIGFAKTPAQNLSLLKRLGEFHRLGRPLLVGTSRKSFIGHLVGEPPSNRLAGTLASISLAITAGCHIVRVHDVGAAVQACRITDAILNTPTRDGSLKKRTVPAP